jgi:transposase
MPAPRKCPDELRERAIRLVLDIEEETGNTTAVCRRIGEELGINSDTLRGWVKRAQIDSGKRPGITTADTARIRQLERENAELRRANAILRTASAFFASELGPSSRRSCARGQTQPEGSTSGSSRCTRAG